MDFSPKTVQETRGYIDRSLMPAIGARRLSKLKPADLDAFYRQLLASGGAGGRPLAPGTVRRIHGILRRALNQGVKWGWRAETESPDLRLTSIRRPRRCRSGVGSWKVLTASWRRGPRRTRRVECRSTLAPQRNSRSTGIRSASGASRCAERIAQTQRAGCSASSSPRARSSVLPRCSGEVASRRPDRNNLPLVGDFNESTLGPVERDEERASRRLMYVQRPHVSTESDLRRDGTQIGAQPGEMPFALVGDADHIEPFCSGRDGHPPGARLGDDLPGECQRVSSQELVLEDEGSGYCFSVEHVGEHEDREAVGRKVDDAKRKSVTVGVQVDRGEDAAVGLGKHDFRCSVAAARCSSERQTFSCRTDRGCVSGCDRFEGRPVDAADQHIVCLRASNSGAQHDGLTSDTQRGRCVRPIEHGNSCRPTVVQRTHRSIGAQADRRR